MKFKKWWKKHWDEVVFGLCIVGAIYFTLKGTGYF
jgi:hypothetical protein